MYIQRANYPRNPNLAGHNRPLASIPEDNPRAPSDRSFQEIVASLLYSGGTNERRPKQLRAPGEDFYTEDFLW